MLKCNTILASLISICFASTALSATCLNKAKLIVKFENVKKIKGDMCISLFKRDNRASFPDGQEDALHSECKAVEDESISFIFEELCYTTYAMAAFQDYNQNGELDKGAFGIPKEPFGFSNNPKINMGPPTWHEASFLIAEEVKESTINLVKY